MKIRSLGISDSDKQSAKIFFDALLSFFDFGGGDALDMFARDGTLTVSQYAYKVANLDVWELSEEHRAKLEGFRPRNLLIGDSYQHMRVNEHRYDLVVVDSPQGLHKDSLGNVHAEHFTVIQGIHTLLKDTACIVLYVNKRPYDRDEAGSHGYDEYAEYDFQKWMAARRNFYRTDSAEIDEVDALNAYYECLLDQNFAVEQTLIVPCHSDVPGRDPYAFRVALSVTRIV